MWFVFAKPPRSDVAYFPGRRLLAVIDAIAWPLAGLLAIPTIPYNTGVMGAVAKALLLLGAAYRCYVAASRNERYRFTTVRWGLLVLGLLVVGGLLKAVT